MLICISDIHISHKSDKLFESQRLQALVATLKQHKDQQYNLAILGDTFDSNSPSLLDIQAFYSIISEITPIFANITIIAGNHDNKVFDYLPHVGFTYYNEVTVLGDITYLPWSNLDYLDKLSINKTFKGTLLLSHARCTIAPFIIEEAPIKVMSDKFQVTVLGDIHSPHNPYSNVYYCSEPTQHHYKSYKKNTTGYILVHKDYSIERIFTDLPYKAKLPICQYHDLEKLLPTLDENNRYKITVQDHVTNLKKLKDIGARHIKFDVVPLVLSQTSNAKEVKDMVTGKISVEQLLFEYITKNYDFDPLITSKILRRLK